MNVDFKITAWERVSIPDNRKEEVLKALKDGTISTANDLIDFLEKKNETDYQYEGMVVESENQLSLELNEGFSTIEAFDDNGIVYENGKG